MESKLKELEDIRTLESDKKLDELRTQLEQNSKDSLEEIEKLTLQANHLREDAQQVSDHDHYDYQTNSTYCPR
jgi:hypothetical protein